MKTSGGAQHKQTAVSLLGLWAVRLRSLQPRRRLLRLLRLLHLLQLQQHTERVHVLGELRAEVTGRLVKVPTGSSCE